MMEYADENSPRPSRDEIRDRRLAEVKGSLAKRLKPVCSHLSSAQFEDLIQSIAETQLRRDGKAMKWGGDK